MITMRYIFCVLTAIIVTFSQRSALAEDRQDLRIAIIGAGAAGLTAALTLSDMGYQQVTVFEASDQVGGKINSISVDGRAYELGAAFILPGFETIFNLADRFSVPYQDSGLRHMVLDRGNALSDMVDFPQRAFGLDSLIRGMTFFGIFRFFNPTGFRDDFALAPSTMNVDFNSFSKRHLFYSLALSAAPMLVGCGYGYADEVPAIYLMQLMDSFVPLFRRAMLFPELMTMPNYVAMFTYGYQTLWNEISRHLNVRLRSPVTKIVRFRDEDGTQRVALTSGSTTEEFDRLVISSPLDKALGFLDASPTEIDLFSRIRYYPYTVTVFRGRNLSRSAITFLDSSTRSDSLGHMTGLYNQFANDDVWTAGQLGSWDMDRDVMKGILKKDVAALGGEVDEILVQQTWSHFPHVKTKDLDEGFYQRMEQLQGISGTYYIGGIMNFDSVEHTARFAKNLMRRKF